MCYGYWNQLTHYTLNPNSIPNPNLFLTLTLTYLLQLVQYTVETK